MPLNHVFASRLLITAAVGLLPALGSATPPAKPPAKPPATAEASAEATAGPPASALVERAASLPARGLFKGEQLSPLGESQLTDLILNALGLQVEVALVVPTGPWQLDGSGPDERNLTPARLDAVKRFLAERGIDPKKIFVESRIDDSITEPRLDLQLLGREMAN